MVAAERASVLKEFNEHFIQHLEPCKNEQTENHVGYSLAEQENYELKLKNIENSTCIEISPDNDDDLPINPVHNNYLENNDVAPLDVAPLDATSLEEVDSEEDKQNDYDDILFLQDLRALRIDSDCDSDISEEFEPQVSSEKEKQNLMFVNNMRNIFIKYIHTAAMLW